MNDNLRIFIQIMDHLEWLTTRDEYGSSRSKDISTREKLASELNEVGIVPKRGYWTTHSLDCFISRMKTKYGKRELLALCDIRFINASQWEIASGTLVTDVQGKRTSLPHWNEGKITTCDDSHKGRFRTIDNDVWMHREKMELRIDCIKKKMAAREYFEIKSRIGRLK